MDFFILMEERIVCMISKILSNIMEADIWNRVQIIKENIDLSCRYDQTINKQHNQACQMFTIL